MPDSPTVEDFGKPGPRRGRTHWLGQVAVMTPTLVPSEFIPPSGQQSARQSLSHAARRLGLTINTLTYDGELWVLVRSNNGVAKRDELSPQ